MPLACTPSFLNLLHHNHHHPNSLSFPFLLHHCHGNTFSLTTPLSRLFPIHLSLSLSLTTLECCHERGSLIDHGEASAPVLNLSGNTLSARVCVRVLVHVSKLEKPMQAFCSAHLWPPLVLSNFLIVHFPSPFHLLLVVCPFFLSSSPFYHL